MNVGRANILEFVSIRWIESVIQLNCAAGRDPRATRAVDDDDDERRRGSERASLRVFGRAWVYVRGRVSGSAFGCERRSEGRGKTADGQPFAL